MDAQLRAKIDKVAAYYAAKEKARSLGTPGTGLRVRREFTTHNNEAGKDRTRDAVSISVTVRPMPFCAKVSL